MEYSLMTFSLMGERMTGHLSAETLCEIGKAAGVRQLDLMEFELKLYGKDALKRAMKAAGLRCQCLISAQPVFSDPVKARRGVDAALEQAKDLGAGMLMLVPGHPSPGEIRACHGLSREEKLEKLADFYRLAVLKARACDIEIGVENTPQFFKPLASAEDCLELLSRVEGLGLIFDTANMKVADTAADELAFYQALKPYIRRVHVKDVVIGSFPHGEVCMNGEKIVSVQTGSGVIRLRELLRALKEDGYDGTLAIEYAAARDVHGTEHGPRVRNAREWIENALEGRETKPPCLSVEGISLPVPRIFFGTAIGPMLRGSNVNGLLDGIYAQGVYAFDCARGYGGAEKSLGTWIKARNNRDRILVLTKCGNVGLTGRVHVDSGVIRKELEESLKALGTDYIDIYLLHRDDPTTPVGEIIECLNEAKRQGKIRVFGASNWTHHRIAEANAYAEAHGLQGFTVSSPNFGLADQVADPWGGDCVTISGPSNAGARAWYAEQGMPVLAYSSLGRGFFSGRFRSGDWAAAEKTLDRAAQKGYLCEDNMERLRRAEVLAEKYGCTVAQIAMSYIFNQNMPVLAIVSTTNPSRMGQNIRAAEMKLSPEEIGWLENVK